MLWFPLRFPHKNCFRFVFTSSCLLEGSCLTYIICVCLRIVVSNTYCVVFCLSSSYVICTQCCQFLWIVHSWLPLRCSLTFICIKDSKLQFKFLNLIKVQTFCLFDGSCLLILAILSIIPPCRSALLKDKIVIHRGKTHIYRKSLTNFPT